MATRRRKPVISRRLAAQDKRVHGERMYEFLLWLQEESVSRRVPFRHLHLCVLREGARRLGLKPPRRLNLSLETLSRE